MSRVSEVQICKSAAATPGDKLKSSSCVRERLPHMQHVFLLHVCVCVCMNYIYPRVYHSTDAATERPSCCLFRGVAACQPGRSCDGRRSALHQSGQRPRKRSESVGRSQKLARFPRVLAALGHIKTQCLGRKKNKCWVVPEFHAIVC